MDDASDPVTLYFIKTNESRADDYPGGLDLIMISEPYNEEGPQDWAELYALSTRIADRTFLSIEYRRDNGEEITGSERGFHLFMYQITDDDHLVVAGVDEDILTELVEEEKIAGSISDSKWFSEVRLTASSSELAAFLASVDVDSLFSQPLGPFTRAAPN